MEHENFKEFNSDDKSEFEKSRAKRQYWHQQIAGAKQITYIKNIQEQDFFKANVLKLSTNSIDFQV